MRKFMCVLCATLLVTAFLPAPPAGAQAEHSAPAMAGAGSQIGVAAAVRGGVQVSEAGAVGRVLKSGQPIFLGQTISTGPDAGLQILLLDETVFTIGPNSSVVIDEFVYNPRTAEGQVSARIVKGAFRFVTGKIARKHPEDMEVKLPAGIIGIRGTICAGLVAGLAASVVLLGPGPKNNTGDPPGKVNVSNAGEDVSLTRPGFGTRIEGPDSAPTPPHQFSQAELEQIFGALAAEAPAEEPAAEGEEGAGEGKSDEAPVSEDAGQTTAGALETLDETQSVSDLSQNVQDTTTQSAQAAADTSTTVADGIATKDQLRTIETGQFYYDFSGVFTQTTKDASPSNVAGTFTAQVNIDFGARTVGGGNSGATFAAGDIEKSATFESQGFSSGTGNATFTDTGGGTTLTFTVNNSDGTIGKTADINIVYNPNLTGSSDDRGSGSQTGVTRTTGVY